MDLGSKTTSNRYRVLDKEITVLKIRLQSVHNWTNQQKASDFYE